jgi:hypothetical protein
MFLEEFTLNGLDAVDLYGIDVSDLPDLPDELPQDDDFKYIQQEMDDFYYDDQLVQCVDSDDEDQLELHYESHEDDT